MPDDLPGVREALIGKNTNGGALGDLHNDSGDIYAGLVEFGHNVEHSNILEISNQSNYDNLVSRVSEYDDTGTATNTNDALVEANELLSSFSADKKFIVLLSDGSPSNEQDPTVIANTIKASGIEIYTITYNNDSIVDDMCYWSSDDNTDVCDNDVPYVYSYQSDDAVSAFDSITSQITSGPEGTLTVTIDGQPYNFGITDEKTMEDLSVGYDNVTCEPATAVCSPNMVPISVGFEGQGEIRLYNLRLDVAEQCGN
jgi:hypothetical protein